MKGTRIEYTSGDSVPEIPGAYWKMENCWFAITPNDLIANLLNHTVTEHADGTISVSPSIRVTWQDKTWHGHLTAGVWKESA